MSKLNQLIQEFCPDGVEYRPIWELTIWDKKFNAVERAKQPQIINYPYLLAKDLFALQQEGGDVFLLSTGEQTGWTTEEMAGDYLCEGEVVTIPWGKSRPVVDVMKYYNGKFVTADNRIATSSDTNILLNKFLFFYMQSKGNLIDSFYRGSGLKHPNMKDVLNLKIPIPPLEVQQEIVRILDSFTELTVELTTELTARKQQYKHYRDELLTFNENTNNVVCTELGTIGKVCMCKRIMKAETSSQGDVPFFKIGTFGGEANAFISRETFEKYKQLYSYPKKGDILISAAGTIGRTVIFNGEPAYFQDSNIVWVDNDENVVLNKYLYYYYQLQPWMASTGGTISRLYNDNIAKAKIFFPSIAEQKRIITILDTFNDLCNDLSCGLPAEIEARQKQYEYYRDQLLTFKEKMA